MYHIKYFVVIYCTIKCVEGKTSNYLGSNPLENDNKKYNDKLKDVVLDIEGYFNPPHVEVNNLKPYDIDTRHYRLKEGYKLARIQKSSTDLWINTKNLDCKKASLVYDEGKPVLLIVNCQNTSGEYKDYFLVNDHHTWVGVRDSFFYSIFNNFVLEKTVDRNIDLDISQDLDDDCFFYNNSESFPFKIIVPNVTISVKKIVDNGRVIWTSPSNSTRFLYLSVYKKTENPLMCLITNSINPKLYFRYDQGKWDKINEAEYSSSLELFGFKLSSFDNSVTLDISNADKNKFVEDSFGSDLVYMKKYTPRPGLKLNKITDGSHNIWSPTFTHDYCNYVSVNVMEGDPTLMVLYIKDNNNKHKLEYFMRVSEGHWKSIKETEYLHFLENKKMPTEEDRNLHKNEPQIHMNYFKNKQGLQIKTYLARPQKKARGAVILVHGNREYFMSNFLNYDKLWNFENFGYPTFPTINSVEDFEMGEHYKGYEKAKKNGMVGSKYTGNVPKYSELFSRTLELGGTTEQLNRFDYECSMVQVFNDMGFDVYGMDLQSYGLSEAAADVRCYAKDFSDHVDDLLQFVDIVKRGNFSNPDLKWNEKDLYSMGTEKFHDNLYLLGYSMGGNIAVQAVQQFYKNTTNKNIDFVNGVISLSGMMKLDQRFSNTLVKTVSLMSLCFMSIVAPRTECYRSGYTNWAINMEDYMKLCDGFYYAKSYPYKTVYQMFKAVDKLKSNMDYYPKTLPTLFIHSKKDGLCSIQGPREIYDKYLKGGPNSQFVELRGNSHATPSPQFIYNVHSVLRDWLNRVSPETSKSRPKEPQEPHPEDKKEQEEKMEDNKEEKDKEKIKKEKEEVQKESSTFELVLSMILALFLVAAIIFGVINIVSRKSAKTQVIVDAVEESIEFKG